VRNLARVLLYGGAAAAVLLLSKIHAVSNGYAFTGSSRFVWALAYIGLLWVAAYAVGLPDLAGAERSPFALSVIAAASAALGISVIQLVVANELLPRVVVFFAAGSLVPWYAGCARTAVRARERARDRDRVVVVADQKEVEYLRHDLGEGAERPAQLVAVLSPQEAGGDSASKLEKVAMDARATIVVLDRAAQADETVVAQAAALHEAGVRVRSLTLFYEEWLGKLPVAELERLSLMFDIAELHRARYARLTRLFDLVLGLAGSLLLLVVLPFVVVGNALANRGPIFYRQPRVGRSGKPFSILKFRTMRPEGPQPFNEWTTEDDPRITRFGQLLRRTHVDELPQVLNVLRRDLAMVGPRPEQPHYVDELITKIPFYNLRHLVRPGITGWAQIKYGYADNESDALEKLQYEFFYLRHQSLSLDARIILRTLQHVLKVGGR
jgi:lipopolysaccharide/colanic/teichoic acid biosynthesis glycosyltransferase